MAITYSQDPIEGTVKDILPVDLKMVRKTELEPLWDELVRRYHYLGHRKMPGANLKYLAFCGGSPVAALSFRAASLTLKPRDCFIGWSTAQRSKHLSQIANNNRFLILPWVRVKNLGSYLLSQVIRQLPHDWYRFYKQQLLLLETFVDPRYFQGTVYQAANWIHVGNTLGFTRQGPTYRYHGHPKEVYLYPLQDDFRSIIGCHQRPYQKPSIPSVSEERSRHLMLLNRVGWDPNLFAELNLKPEEVYRLSELLLNFCQRFSACFKRKEQLFNAITYIKGLSSELMAKSIEPIALYLLGAEKVRSLQHFFSGGSWEAAAVTRENQAVLAEKISDENGMFTLDSSEFPKKGKDSAGVAPQYCGHLGKVANCQSGVFLGYTSEKGYGLLDQKLYVPKPWFEPEYAERRKKTRFPEELTFKTKPQLALELLQKAEQTGAFTGRWVGVDSFFGSNQEFLDAVGEKYYYFADIRSHAQLWLERPQVGLPPYKGRGPYPKKEKPKTDPIPVSDIAKDPSLRWETVNLGEGAKGPIIAQVTRLRVVEQRDGLPGKELWLFLRKNADGEMKYALSNAPNDISMEEMVRASQMRWTIEQLFQEGKSYLGMDHYELRSYPGWHRHMALVSLTMHFLLEVRLQFGKKNFITLPIAQKLLVASLTQNPKTIRQAIKIVTYQFHRAEVARISHRKKMLQQMETLLL